jgi:hypothetical protein
MIDHAIDPSVRLGHVSGTLLTFRRVCGVQDVEKYRNLSKMFFFDIFDIFIKYQNKKKRLKIPKIPKISKQNLFWFEH